jgi:hypothetical protein
MAVIAARALLQSPATITVCAQGSSSRLLGGKPLCISPLPPISTRGSSVVVRAGSGVPSPTKVRLQNPRSCDSPFFLCFGLRVRIKIQIPERLYMLTKCEGLFNVQLKEMHFWKSTAQQRQSRRGYLFLAWSSTILWIAQSEILFLGQVFVIF